MANRVVVAIVVVVGLALLFLFSDQAMPAGHHAAALMPGGPYTPIEVTLGLAVGVFVPVCGAAVAMLLRLARRDEQIKAECVELINAAVKDVGDRRRELWERMDSQSQSLHAHILDVSTTYATQRHLRECEGRLYAAIGEVKNAVGELDKKLTQLLTHQSNSG